MSEENRSDTRKRELGVLNTVNRTSASDKNTKHNELGRRDFLKMVGAGGVLTLLGWKALDSVIDILDEVKSHPSYYEINEGTTIPLLLNGGNEFKNTKIIYDVIDPSFLGKLQARKQDGEVVMPIKLQPGERTIRMVGEILEPALYELKKSELLPENVTVSYYPNGEPPKNTDKASNLPNEARVFGIKVITWDSDYVDDNKQPYEINKRNSNERGEITKFGDLSYFGEGWAIGAYNKEENVFKVIGYVSDVRALEVVNP